MAKGLSLAYLMLYNLACCGGWAYILFLCVKNIQEGSIDQIYAQTEDVLKVTQTAACLEVLHSLIGLVKSPWNTAFTQVFSRVWVLWAIMHVAPPAQTSLFTALTVTSWSLVEVPRYLFYALNLVDAVPYPLFWLRYSLFAVLYPTGISGELGCTYMAAMFLRGDGPIMELPQQSLMLLVLIALVALMYIPGSPKMYGHMVKTRKKQFDLLKSGGKKKDGAADAKSSGSKGTKKQS